MARMETKVYRINPKFAMDKGIPSTFVACELVEAPSKKAVYLYGHGEMDPTGRCARCGRMLTHPGSILIGIGPECLGSWSAREEIKDNMTAADIARLKALVWEQMVDCWIPKAVINETHNTDKKVFPPKDHPVFTPKPVETKRARLVEFKSTGGFAIQIFFPFDPELINKVKTLSGRQYHNVNGKRYWTCPLEDASVRSLIEWGFEIDDLLMRWFDRDKVTAENISDEEINLDGFGKGLYPFQKRGVAFIEHNNGRALIADEMGLGKTVQALAYLHKHPELRPAVVVSPAHLKLNWAREIAMCMGEQKVQILQGTQHGPIWGDIIIVNYDILHPRMKTHKGKDGKTTKTPIPGTGWAGPLSKCNAMILIPDEVHYAKNSKANRTKALKKMADGIPHVIAISGTPATSRPIELYNGISMVAPGLFPSFWKYAHRYCGAEHTGYGWDFKGATNMEELHEKLVNTIMIRRLKKDVLPELPDKTRVYVPFELSNQAEYLEAQNNFVSWVRKTKGDKAAKKANVLAKIEALKQLSVKGKLEQACDWIENTIQEEKLIVFAIHKNTIDYLMKRFKDVAVKIDGSVPVGKKRQEIEDRFQNDPNVRLFIGNIEAAGTGLTLTAATTVAFLELPWTPGEVVQAEDRAHRIGQENAVSIYFLLGHNTIDHVLAGILDSKMVVLDKVLDGKVTEDESLLTRLMGIYYDGNQDKPWEDLFRKEA